VLWWLGAAIVAVSTAFPPVLMFDVVDAVDVVFCFMATLYGNDRFLCGHQASFVWTLYECTH